MTDDLFALARRTDPHTSRDAARSVKANRLESLIAGMIAMAGDKGMTCDEIVDATGLNWNTVSPRLSPLRRKSIITTRLNPATNRPFTCCGKSGRRQLVWFSTKGK